MPEVSWLRSIRESWSSKPRVRFVLNGRPASGRVLRNGFREDGVGVETNVYLIYLEDGSKKKVVVNFH
jgi:hypothetical protein